MQESSRGNGMPGFVIVLAVLLGGVGLLCGQGARADTMLDWAWANGSNDENQAGSWGTRGVAAASNTPGGRERATAWTDASGTMWLFGGVGLNDEFYSDLWKYVPSTGNWTWMKGYQEAGSTMGAQGVPSASCLPARRISAVSWTDPSGALWMFGGYIYGGGFSDELWKYSPSTGNWAWMKGDCTLNYLGNNGTQGVPADTNLPCARDKAATWTDASGALWMFGGRAIAGGPRNDLWKFDPATNNWTWMKGASSYFPPGVYGTLGTPAGDNTPGGRNGSAAGTDASGNLWLFGGYGYDSAGNEGFLNDLWKYTPSLGEWTWMKGGNSVSQPGVYGTQGTAAPGNTPGARSDAVLWSDGAGALWLFGGNGGVSGLNDLWKYDIATGNWAWIKGGSGSGGVMGTYGTLGTTAPDNTPGSRERAVGWTDGKGVLWLFGGMGQGEHSYGRLSDLWRITVFDKTPPTGSIVINANRSTTNSRTVSIAMNWEDGIGGSGVARMRFSDDGSTWSAYESLTASKSYTLPVGDDGYRTVRVQFIDKANNRSATCSDYIRLDRSVPTGGIVINDGASTTTTQAVTLKLNWADTGSGVARMRFSDNGSTWTSWLYPTGTRAHTLPGGLGYHTVRVQYLDGANNYSPVYNDYIKLVAP